MLPKTLRAVAAALMLAAAPAALPKDAGDYVTDLKDYVVSPLHWDAQNWRWAGDAALGIAAAYALDNTVRDHFVSGSVPAGQDPHSNRDAAPLALLTVGAFAMGVLTHDKALKSTGVDMGEAVVLATMSSYVFKTLAGRERPNETPLRSRFGHGGDGFPSGHTAAAFAAAQVFADRMPREQWGWRVLAYGLAGGTAYLRLDSNVHWFSDTVAGAALGMATGRFVSGRDEQRKSRVAFWVAPLDHGALVSFSVNTD